MLPSPSKPEGQRRMNVSIHGETTASELQDRVTELIEQQTAVSEVLRAIANSPHDLQPIFDAILDSATRLCRADVCSLRLSEESGLRRVAMRGDPLSVSQMWSSFPALAEKGSLLSQLTTPRLPNHFPDLTALESHRRDFWTTVVNAGFRSGLIVPLLNDNKIVGTINLFRKQLQPFTDREISLFMDFAAEATIVRESSRRKRQYCEAQIALAHANRIATIGQLTASIAHELNQPLTAVAAHGGAVLRWLARQPPGIDEARNSVEHMIKDADRATHIIGGLRDLTKQNAASRSRGPKRGDR
jgi:GAF domain-containing protein